MVCLLYGLFGFIFFFVHLCIQITVLRIVLHIHNFIFPAFRYLRERSFMQIFKFLKRQEKDKF